jgi:predicted negative regulator of RcsB-dependent stress response
MADFLENPEELLKQAKESKTLKIASIVVGSIALLAIIWFSYKQFIFNPANEKSKTSYWRAMVFLQNDENDQALDEFKRIAKQYDGKIGGEISQYMAGRLYMDQGEFKTALSYLEKAKVDDLYVGTLIIGLQGDCQVELGDFKKAASLYEKASKRKPNEFTTPMFLMKAAQIQEFKLNNFKEAAKMYKQIELDYFDYYKTNNVEKYLERASNKEK